MLCLVLFTVGFIYYFRRQAWNAHSAAETSYRNKNKKSVDPKPSKGGLFSLDNIKMKRRNSQIFTENDGNDKNENENENGKNVPKNYLDDMEQNFNYQNNNDDEDDDQEGVRNSKLAKSMQSHHDEIDKQLIDQNTLLHDLQNTLRKEVDDLKCLLSVSNQTDSDNDGKYNNDPDKDSRIKKLVSLLNKLKNDINNRKFYEKSLDTAENKIHNLLRNLIRLLTQGPAIIADEIVEQISLQIFDKIVLEKINENCDIMDGSHENGNGTEMISKRALCLSFTLQNLYNELGEIKEFVTMQLLPMTTEEGRRKQIVENIFDSNMKLIINNSISSLVLEQITICRDQEAGVDKACDGVNHVYDVFVQRTPQFIGAMNKGVEV